jgi:hypothetical protein
MYLSVLFVNVQGQNCPFSDMVLSIVLVMNISTEPRTEEASGEQRWWVVEELVERGWAIMISYVFLLCNI